VSAIEPSIQFEEINRACKKSTGSLSAYDLYLRALFELNFHEPNNHSQAENLLRQAIKIDQNYADAFAQLAVTIGRSLTNGWLPFASRPGALAEALAAARRAVQLDNTNPAALARNAFVEAVFEGSYERSDDCAERALRLAPSSADVRLWCGTAYAYGGACDAAVQNLEAALRLSPLDRQAHQIYHGLTMAHVFARRFEEAESWARRALADYPKLVALRRYLAVALAHCGRIAEARLVIAEVRRLQPESSLSLSRTSHFRHSWQMDIYIDGLRLAGLPE
jgi:adenylate cyclase